MRSKAVVFTGPNQVEWTDIESVDPGPNDVVIDIWHSWVSNGTEGSFLRGERLSGDEAWQRGDPMPFPMVAGYQKVGPIVKMGENVEGFEIGQVVFAAMSRVTGMFDNRFAGHVSPAVCDKSQIIALPPGLDPVHYSGLVLTQVGYNCGSRPNPQQGDVAVVIGDGLVGQWAAQTLKASGAGVVLVGKHADRMAKAAPFAEIIPTGADFGLSAFDTAGFRDVQILVETVGRVDGLYTWLPRMKRGGHMVIAGFYKPSGEVNLQRSLEAFRNHELSIDLVSGATGPRLHETMRWIADGRIKTGDLITHRFPVERAAEAWELIESKREPVLGVVFDWPAYTSQKQ